MKVTIDLEYEEVVLALALYMEEGNNMNTKKSVQQAMNWYVKKHHSDRPLAAVINEAVEETATDFLSNIALTHEEALLKAQEEWDQTVAWCLKRGQQLKILPSFLILMDIKSLLFHPPANTLTKELLVKHIL